MLTIEDCVSFDEGVWILLELSENPHRYRPKCSFSYFVLFIYLFIYLFLIYLFIYLFIHLFKSII